MERALALKPDIPKDYLLRNEEGKPYTAGGLKSMWQRLIRKAVKSGVLEHRYKFKHLRKKAATDVAEQRDEIEASKLLAHSDPKVTRKNYIQPRGRRS